MNASRSLKPLGILPSLGYFFLPAGVCFFFVYALMPWVHQQGWGELATVLFGLTLPLLGLLAASLTAFVLEGSPRSRAAFVQRFRLERPRPSTLLWSLAVLAGMVLGFVLLGWTVPWLLQFPLFAPPEFLPPIVDPRHAGGPFTPDGRFLGVALPGQWWIVAVYAGILAVNILGEEFWWRGYILPRQERAFGRWTWLVHGLLWTGFHVFWKWNLLVLLPGCLVLAFVAQKTRSTWPGILAHTAINGLGLVPVVLGVLGVLG